MPSLSSEAGRGHAVGHLLMRPTEELLEGTNDLVWLSRWHEAERDPGPRQLADPYYIPPFLERQAD